MAKVFVTMDWISGACGVNNIHGYRRLPGDFQNLPQVSQKRTEKDGGWKHATHARGELGTFIPPGGSNFGFCSFSKNIIYKELGKEVYDELAALYKIVYQSPARENVWHPEYGKGSFFVIYDMDKDSDTFGLEPMWPFTAEEHKEDEDF